MRLRLSTGLAALGALALQLGTAAAAPRDVSGTYLTEDGRARIRLEKCGATGENVCGFVVWLQTPTTENGMLRTDLKNSDRRKTARQLLGHQLILGLAPNADDRWEGPIYNSEDGRSYQVNVWLNGPEELKVRGCLLAVLCATQTWARVKDVAPGQLVAATGAPGGPVPDAEWASAKPPATTPAANTRRDPKPKS